VFDEEKNERDDPGRARKFDRHHVGFREETCGDAQEGRGNHRAIASTVIREAVSTCPVWPRVALLTPSVISLGGGLSQLALLYEELPELIVPHLFRRPSLGFNQASEMGDASGSRNAAQLWDSPGFDSLTRRLEAISSVR
jgi:fructokinase